MAVGVVIASFGERPYLGQLIETCCDLPVVLYTDRDRGYPVSKLHIVPDGSHQGPRGPIRMTNRILAEAADFDPILCLNDDMKIVSPNFLEGFALAERFGVCVPMNPRIYVKYNAMGADAPADPPGTPLYGTACNVSPMFVSRARPGVRVFMEAYVRQLETCQRGTLAFWLASWETGFCPLYLPEQWCLCASNAEYFRGYKKTLQGREYQIEPIMLHWGQAGVREVFDAK